MPKNVKNQCKLYADDFKVIGIFKEEKDIEQIQIDVNVLQKWAKTWQVSFNYDSIKVTFIVKVLKSSTKNLIIQKLKKIFQ